MQAANGYVITEPFVTSIADSELLYCNEPDKKLRLKDGEVVVNNLVADNEILYVATQKIENAFTATAQSNEWNSRNGQGVLTFEDDVEITISNNAFTREPVSVVKLGNNVTSIGERAFDGCIGLTSIKIPNSVTSIGRGAFYGCSSLTSVTIPNSVTSIGNDAFKYCNNLSSVTIGSGVTSIGYNAFLVNYVGQSAYHVTIPASVTNIGNCAFCGFSNIYLKSTTPITLGNWIRAFGDIYDGSGSGSGAGEPLKIIVPDQAYDDYINAAETDAGWAYYKDVLVAESSMNQNNV